MYVYVFVHLDIVDIVIFDPFIANVFVLSSLITTEKTPLVFWTSQRVWDEITDMVYGM